MEAAVWFGAISTFLAVLVALFKEDITNWRRRPILNLGEVKLAAPACNKIQTEIKDTTGKLIDKCESYYLRLWIKNIGKQRAADVQVFASALWRQQADGSFKEAKNFLPMNLKWVPTEEVFTKGISPLMGKYCYLVNIPEPRAKSSYGKFPFETNEGEAILVFVVEFNSSKLGHIRPPGVYRLEIKIAAANAKPVTKKLEITFPGKWYDDEEKMFSDGLGLKEIS